MMGRTMSSTTASRECFVLMLMVLMMLGLREKGGVEALSQVPTLSELGYAWPKGTYAIPVMGAGKCPGVSGYEDEEEWRTGQLAQNVVHEWRDGARGGVGMRIAEGGGGGGGSGVEGGIGGGREEYALTVARGARESREQAKNSFCTKTVAGEYSSTDFMPGRYCLWKKNDCPANFYEGWIQLDHTQSTTTVSSGVLPDGTYDNRTVLITFCCRNDGSPDVGIRLPDVRPFALLRLGHSPCQAVDNMDVTEASSFLEGVATVSDGLSPELDAAGGDGGDLEGTASASNRTRVWSCVYRPRNCTGRCLAAFLDVFFVFFVVGVIVLAVCLQMRKRCSVKRGARARASSSSSSTTTKQLHFFYDSDEDDDDDDDDEGERSIGYEPLLPFYHRRRCPVGRDHGELGLRRCGGSTADSRAPPTSVLVARLPTQPSTTDDDGDESDDEDDDDEDIAWDVTVFVQLPQQQSAGSLGTTTMGRKDEAVLSSSTGGEGHAGGRGSPPPPYEEAAAAVGDSLSGGMTGASASSVAEDDDAMMMEMEKMLQQQQQQQQAQ